MKAIVTYGGQETPDEYSNVVQITTSGVNGEVLVNFKGDREQLELSDVKATTIIED